MFTSLPSPGGGCRERNRGELRPPQVSQTSHTLCLHQESDLEEVNTHDEGPLTFPLVPYCCPHEHGIIPRLEGRVNVRSASSLSDVQQAKPDRLHYDSLSSDLQGKAVQSSLHWHR